jgi:membrane-associated HD superfamily phosphohydrolase
MSGVVLIVIILLIFLMIQHRNIKKNKRDKKWVYGLSICTFGLSICLIVPIPLDRVILLMNETVGAFTNWVVAG